jgi:hypothetical protein
MTTFLQEQNPISIFDPFVTFNEKEHKYFVNGVHYKPSVTGFVKHFFPEFDNDRIIARMMANKKKWNSASLNPYYGKTAQDIKNQWETNREKSSSDGTHMHQTIEYFYNQPPTLWKQGGTVETFDQVFANSSWDTIAFRQFLQWHLDVVLPNQWIPFRTELKVFDHDYQIAGSVDMLFRSSPSSTNELILVDWKNSKKISFRNDFKEKGLHSVCTQLDHCNYNHYSLQLNVYKYLLHKNTSFRVVAMYLVVLHESQEMAQMIAVPDLSSAIYSMLEFLRTDPERDQNWK